MKKSIFLPGLVSVTFRSVSCEKLIEYIKKSGLSCVEFGGDVHIPHGDIKKAEEVKNTCKKNNIDIVSYGSYYRAGTGQDFNSILETAAALGASNIRVWAGSKNRSEYSSDEYKNIIQDLQNICFSANERNITISAECHGGTITDKPVTAAEAAFEINSKINNFFLYWQPNQFESHAYNIAGLAKMLPYVSNIHVFAWENNLKFPLAHHKNRWEEYIALLKETKKTHSLLLEFVHDGTPEAFFGDCETLLDLIL